jgi:hypothetical protein
MRWHYFGDPQNGIDEATGAEEETKISSSGEWGKYRNPTRLRGGVVHKLGLGGSVMAVARRQFLQALGAVCGLQFLLPTAVRAAELQYVSTLNTSARKLAVLVGINQYESNPLHGCITDVELQRELLVHRFGFFAPRYCGAYESGGNSRGDRYSGTGTSSQAGKSWGCGAVPF